MAMPSPIRARYEAFLLSLAGAAGPPPPDEPDDAGSDGVLAGDFPSVVGFAAALPSPSDGGGLFR